MCACKSSWKACHIILEPLPCGADACCRFSGKLVFVRFFLCEPLELLCGGVPGVTQAQENCWYFDFNRHTSVQIRRASKPVGR